MPTTTTTYSFNKPVVGADEDDWGGYLNGNWDSVDDLLDGTTPVTGIDINSGTLDGVTIGGTTAGAGTFTTLTATTSITGTLATAAQPNITSVGSLTSLDVGGAITADGLTVENATGSTATLSSTKSGTWSVGEVLGQVNFEGDDTSGEGAGVKGRVQVRTVDTLGAGYAMALQTSDGTNGIKDRLVVEPAGNISFYEDTGTTAKFFWDASAEVLGIGTATPNVFSNTGLHIHDSTTSRLHMTNGTTGSAYTDGWEMQAFSDDFYILGREAAGDIIMYPANSEAMRITSSGNVGIGTSSPDNKLTIGDSSSIVVGKQWGLDFQDTAKGEPQAFIYAEGQYTANFNTDLIFGTIGTSGSATERMRIDSSGNVGIGTSSPSAALDVLNGSGNGEVAVFSGTDSDRGLSISTFAVGGFGQVGVDLNAQYSSSPTMTLSTGGTEAMRITSSGNVGIGTSTTTGFDGGADDLIVGSGSASTGMTIYSGATGYGSLHFADANSSPANYVGYVNYNHSTNSMQFATNNTERMRIDSSGNLLVGTTDASQAANTSGNGTVIGASGGLEVSRDSFSVAYFNKTSVADGTVVEIRKQGINRGNIGYVGQLVIHNSDMGIGFSNDDIRPVNGSGVNTDNSYDLGHSSVRWKDLYLSGGVYLGGTGSANKLDDYEESSFGLTTASDPTGALDANSYGYYVKVGSMVTVQIVFQCTANFTSNKIGDLPFVPINHSTVISTLHGGGVIFYGSSRGFVRVSNNDTKMYFTDTSGAAVNPSTTNDPFRFTITYRTS